MCNYVAKSFYICESKKHQTCMSKKILVVDDDVAFCTLLQTFLKKKGFDVTTSFTGKEASDIIEKHIFDVVITDIRLPDSDGMEILKKTKEKKYNIICFFFFCQPKI